MNLHSISVSQLQMLESGQFIKRLITDFDNSKLVASTDPEFELQINELKAQFPTYSDALMQIQAQEESKEIAALDVHRDRKFSTVRRAINVYEFSDDPAEQVLYHRVMLILDKYNRIESATYEAESLGIVKFIKEIREAADDAMNKLGLTKLIDYLEAANDNFQNKFDQRSSENISTVHYNSKQLRKEIFTTYNDLASYVLIMAKRKKTPFFITLLEVVNNGRAYYDDTLAHRAAINKRDDA
ncbi:DUF6261 family protein [Flavobacterium sp. SM2513]|uniref:DUF6261 family protein n=1 Tax=Flavobacterium sp. SM2513 TaxID=3424766 RepID=UPI003D7F534B